MNINPKELLENSAVVHQQNEAPAGYYSEKLISFGRMPYKYILSGKTDKIEKAIERALVCTNLHQ